jgi:hypothetical protein
VAESRSVPPLYSKQKFIQCVEEEVNGYYENALSQESQISTRLSKDGQTTKENVPQGTIGAKLWITSLNSHFCSGDHDAAY